MGQNRNRRVQEVVQELGKIPPQAIDVEEALIGTILQTGAYQFAYKTVSSKMFYKETNRLVYEAIESLANRKDPIDMVSVVSELKKEGKLELVGGYYYISEINNKATAVPHKIDFYARIIYQTYVARELIALSSDIQEECFDIKNDVADTMEKIQKVIHQLYKSNYLDVPKIMMYEKVMLKKMIFDGAFYSHVKATIPDNFFLDRVHAVIWNTMGLLTDANIEINRDSLEDIFFSSKNEKYIPYLGELLETDYPSEDNYEYIFLFLKRYYDRVQIVKIYDYLEEHRAVKEPEEIVAFVDMILDDIRTKDVEIKKFGAWLDKTYMSFTEHAIDGYKGLKTGYDKVDRVGKLEPHSIVLVGGATGTGKTRFITNLAYRIVRNNPDVAVCGIFMEEKIDKIQRIFFSVDTGLSSDQMQSKNYKLQDEDKNKLRESYSNLKRFGGDIEIIDDIVNIRQAESIFSKFAKKKKGKQPVLILDNLMQLADNDGKTATEDMIARTLSKIMKKTGGLLFVLHHFTKEQKAAANADEGYRPREEHLKGSTRYTDVATHVWLFHRPNKYPDLLRKQSMKLPVEVDGKEYPRRSILKRLLITEFTKLREGTDDEGERLIRFLVDYDHMKIKEWR